jgi:hypothetical protein
MAADLQALVNQFQFTKEESALNLIEQLSQRPVSHHF